MKPWTKRADGSASAAVVPTESTLVAVSARTVRPFPAVAIPLISVLLGKPRPKPGRISAALPARVWLESVSFEDRQRRWRADEVEPRPRRCRMRRTADHGAGVDCGRVVPGRDRHIRYRMARLFLEDRFRLPGDAGIRKTLKQKERCLPMVNMRENGDAVLHAGVVHLRFERRTAGFHERCLDLPGDAFIGGVRHHQPH